ADRRAGGRERTRRRDGRIGEHFPGAGLAGEPGDPAAGAPHRKAPARRAIRARDRFDRVENLQRLGFQAAERARDFQAEGARAEQVLDEIGRKPARGFDLRAAGTDLRSELVERLEQGWDVHGPSPLVGVYAKAEAVVSGTALP